MSFDFRSHGWMRVLITVLVVAAMSVWAMGQISASSGAIQGTVTDPTGAVVSNATVTVSSASGANLSKKTSAEGLFVFPLMDPGTYSVVVEAPGFKKVSYPDVKVQITQVTALPIQLQVGAENTEVTVESAAAPAVNVTNATLGETVDSRMVSELPLPTRNFVGLLAMNPATSSDLPQASGSGRGSATVFVAGQRGTFNNLVINGIDANNLGNNNFTNVPIPSPDTIEEFRVQTSMYDASQGKSSGGNIDLVTKSGTAKYHGEVYEFFRNEALNANGWFFNHNKAKKPILRQNQYGGNFGGPVPGLGKTFFFGSWQGTKQLNGLAGAVTGPWPVIPASRSQADIESAFKMTPGSLDPVTLKLLQAKGNHDGFLIPSGTGAAAGSFGTIAESAPQRWNDNQFNANVDHWFGGKHHLSGKFFWANGQLLDPLGGEGSGSLGSGETRPFKNRVLSLDHTWVISTNLVNEFRAGYTRNISAINATDPLKVGDIGMNKFNSAIFPGIPLLFTDDLGPSFGGITTNDDQASTANTFDFADTLAYTHGAHAMRIGVETRRYQINLFNNFASRGFLHYTSFQNFLTGNIFDAFVGTGITDRGFRARDIAGFYQDDWKIRRNLSLNLGVRWDYMGPSTDVRNRLGNFDPSRLDAATLASGGPGLLNGFILPAAANFGAIKGTPGVSPSTLLGNDYNNFAPRVGFAWDPWGDGKTAVRGGYGMYFIRISNQMLLQLITAAPFFQLSRVIGPPPGTVTMSNPFPALPVPSQFPIFPATPKLTGFSASGAPLFDQPLITLNPFERDMRTPYTQNWNFTIERDLGAGYTMQLGYVGTKGTRLLYSRQVNQAELANAQNPIRGVTSNSTTNISARVPVVGFSSGGLNEVTDEGMSHYNALIAAVNKRIGALSLQANYTWSKSLDNNSGSDTQDLGSTPGNQLDLSQAQGLSNFDRRHRGQVSYSYEVPFFKSGMLHKALGGWSVGGLTVYQTGRPITFACSSCNSNNLFGNSGMMPDLVGDLNALMKTGSPEHYVDSGTSMFNTGILANPTTYTAGQSVSGLNVFGGPGNQTYTIGPAASAKGQFFGTLRRNPGPRGPNQQQWNMYVSKSIPLREGVNFVFRSEFFNLFNHPSFNAPLATFGPSTFGRITSTQSDPRIIQFAAKVNF